MGCLATCVKIATEDKNFLGGGKGGSKTKKGTNFHTAGFLADHRGNVHCFMWQAFYALRPPVPPPLSTQMLGENRNKK